MKKLLYFAFMLIPYLASSQKTSQDIKQMVVDKSFIFVATASFGDQPQHDFWETTFGPAPMTVGKMQSLERNADLTRAVKLNDYVQSGMASAASKMTKSKSENHPVVYIDDVSALFHPAVFQPTFFELVGRNPDSLNNPFPFENYTVKTNKRGKITVEFKISDDLYNRTINMIISPEGKAQMTIATAVKRYNDARRTKQYYKGYIQELASL